MKRRPSIFFVILLVFSCNQVKIDPVDPNEVPTAAFEVVKSRFPNAQDLEFKAILASKIWEVGFKSGTDSYLSLVDQTKMWETYRANYDSLPPILPDMISKSPFGGGTFSFNSEDVDFYPTVQRRNRVIHNYYSRDYALEWVSYIGTNYKATTTSFEQNLYKIPVQSLAALPKEIRDYMAQKKDLSYQYGEVRVRLNYEKQYWLQVLFNRDGKDYLGFMLFDENGALKWTSREFNQPFPDNQVTNLDTLPEAIQKHLDNSPELATFQYITSGLDKWRSEYDGISSYYLRFRKNGYSQMCELYFDQDGNLLNKRYFLGF